MNNAYADYLRYVRDHPVSFVTYNPDALTALADRFDKGNVDGKGYNTALKLAGPQSSQGWEGVYEGPFSFPQDHGPHYNIRNEWYYLAGNFPNTANPSQPISIVFSSKRRGIIPPGRQAQGSTPATYDLWLEQLAITLPFLEGDQQHINHLDYVLASDKDTQVSATASPFRWNVGNNDFVYRLYSPTNDMFPMKFEVQDTKRGVVINLTLSLPPTKLSGGKGYFLEGDKGCAPCISGLGYRYYSWPLLLAQGTILAPGLGAPIPIEGQMWLDHQWGARMGPLGYTDSTFLRAVRVMQGSVSPPIPRWNWFFFQLSDGTQVTTARLPAGPASDGKGPFQLTNTTVIRSVDGTYDTKRYTGTVTYDGFITDPITKATYPSGWTIDVMGMKLHLKPTVVNQFLGNDSDVGVWEGGVLINGVYNDKAVTGYGFAEMMGYESDKLTFQNAMKNGLGMDPTKVDMFLPSKPSGWERFGAGVYVFLPLVLLALVVGLSFKFKSWQGITTLIVSACVIYIIVMQVVNSRRGRF